MHTQRPARWHMAAIGVILLGGVGCAAKGIHATSEAEYSQSGSAGSGSETADAVSIGHGPGGGPGGDISEHELGSPGLGGFGAGAMDAGRSEAGGLGMGSGGLAQGGDGSSEAFPEGRFGGPGGGDGSDAAASGFPGFGGQQGVDGDLGPNGVPDPLEGLGDQEPFPDMTVSGPETELQPLGGFEQLEPGEVPAEDYVEDGLNVAKVEPSDAVVGGFEQLEPGEVPAEDRVEDGLNVAKVEPSDAFDVQIDSLEQDRASKATAELEDVFFGYDSWRILEDAKESLRRDAVWLRGHSGSRLMVEGHCDERGSAAYNLVLGEKRAKAVRNYLAELGVRSFRVNVVSYGEERPFCSEPTDMCYHLNRRGHLFLESQ